MRPERNEIRVVLFDVGGVLVELSGLAMLLSWLGPRVTAEQVRTLWLASPVVRLFETGKMQPVAFAEQMISELSLRVGSKEFLSELYIRSQRLLPGAVELVRRVPRSYVRATLWRLIPLNPCSCVEFPVVLKGKFRPHYAMWSEQQRIERQSPQYLRNVIRLITETGLRVKKELLPMKKDQVDLTNRTIWIPDSKTDNGIAEVPLTPIATDALRNQIALSGPGQYLFPSEKKPGTHQKSLKKVWRTTLKKAGIPNFRIYDLRSTYSTRLSAGGLADEWVTQMLRQGDAQVMKKYSQMKLQMKRSVGKAQSACQ